MHVLVAIRMSKACAMGSGETWRMVGRLGENSCARIRRYLAELLRRSRDCDCVPMLVITLCMFLDSPLERQRISDIRVRRMNMFVTVCTASQADGFNDKRDHLPSQANGNLQPLGAQIVNGPVCTQLPHSSGPSRTWILAYFNVHEFIVAYIRRGKSPRFPTCYHLILSDQILSTCGERLH